MGPIVKCEGCIELYKLPYEKWDKSRTTVAKNTQIKDSKIPVSLALFLLHTGCNYVFALGQPEVVIR
jgi:hypothetical protein